MLTFIEANIQLRSLGAVFSEQTEFRQSVVRQALDSRKQAPAPAQSFLRKVLKRSGLRVKGFANPYDAPTILLENKISDQVWMYDDLLAAVLSIWAETQTDLRKAVTDFLQDKNVEIGHSFAFINERAFSRSCLQSDIEALGELFLANNSVYDSSAFVLMAVCLTSCIPLNAEQMEQLTERHPDGAADSAQEFWKHHRSYLDQLDANTPDWVYLPPFIDALVALRDLKLAERTARRLKESLNPLLSLGSEVLQYFGLDDAVSWSQAQISPDQGEPIGILVQTLIAAIDAYYKSYEKVASTLTEDRVRRKELERAEDQILQASNDLRKTLQQSHTHTQPSVYPDVSSFHETVFGKWLQDLGAIDPDSTIWQGVESTAHELLELYEHKQRLQSAHADELQQAITQLQNLPHELLAYFNLGDVNDWHAANVPVQQALDFKEDIEKLLTKIAEYSEYVAIRTQNLSAERERRFQLEEIENQIEVLSRTLSANLSSSSTRMVSVGVTVDSDLSPIHVDRPAEYNEVKSPLIEDQGNWEADHPFPPATERASQLPLHSEPMSISVINEEHPFSVEAIANSILNDGAYSSSPLLPKLAWALLEESRLSAAYQLVHLVQHLEISDEHVSELPPDWLIKLLILGRNVRREEGEIATEIKSCITKYFRTSSFHSLDGSVPQELAYILLLVAATLRPALLTPMTDASQVLRSLHLPAGFSEIYQFCLVIIDFARDYRALDPSVLIAVKNEATFEEELASLKRKSTEWRNTSRQITFSFQPSNMVWSRWHEHGNLFDILLQPLIEDDFAQVEKLRNIVSLHLMDDVKLRAYIEETYSHLSIERGRGVLRKGFQPRALRSLMMRVHEATQLVSAWVDISSAFRVSRSDYDFERAEYLRHDLLSRYDRVFSEINHQKDFCKDSTVAAALHQLKLSLKNIFCLFDPQQPLPSDALNSHQLLNIELLRLPNLDLGDNWGLQNDFAPKEVLSRLFESLAEGALPWDRTFRSHFAARNHESSGYVLDYLQSPLSGEHGCDCDSLRAEREQNILACRDAFTREVDEVSNQVELAVAYGFIDEDERTKLSSMLFGITSKLPDIVNFQRAYKQLDEVRSRINADREIKKDEVRKRLNALELAEQSAEFLRLARTIDAGDVLTANEYIDLLEKSQSLPESSTQRDAFRDYFPEKARRIEEYLEKTSPIQVVNEVTNLTSVAGVTMEAVPGKQRDQAKLMLQTWLTMKRKHQASIDELRIFLDALGFSVRSIKLVEKRGEHQIWFDIVTVPVESCPVPEYGSEANGHYRLVCLWDRPPEDRIVADIGKTGLQAPPIILYFARMSEQRHRDFAQLCKDKRRTVILVDEKLLFYLCGERGSRLTTLFECTLPFTFVEPYTITSSTLPPEMFFGRSLEKDSIIDERGSCFIYGGRQLGKTVLLRAVQREFHNPAQGRIGLWIDLKAEGIGYARQPSDIWRLISTQLYRNDSSMIAAPLASPDRLFEALERWLSERSSRRILVLLDEADRFLEADGTNEFQISTRLKNWMDRTHRRIKIVFAGLHNVLRTTTQSNNPLAHLGAPICIGPLLDNGEWREARRLVESPLSAMGYRFESNDLITRILSQTNYYPSLIQIYCSYMLSMFERDGSYPFDPKHNPPFTITSKQVDEVYKRRDLVSLIRERFRLTLQLDQRYEVIAYVIAWASLHNPERAAVDGFDVAWIRKEALDFWQAGFSSTAHNDSFSVLLQEMEGLGVLRITDSGNYTLRSPNVVLLMGTLPEIEERLERERQPPVVYVPAQFRSAYRNGKADSALRSPFTALQEATLREHQHSVIVIFGTRAAGLDHIMSYIGNSFEEEEVVALQYEHYRTFHEQLENLIERRARDGVNLLVVSHNCDWNEAWIEEAYRRVSRLTARKAVVHVVFVADSAQTRILVRDARDLLSSINRRNMLNSFTISPWQPAALQQWLDDCSYSTDDRMSDVERVTGCWPFLLYRLHDGAKGHGRNLVTAIQELDEAFTNPKEVVDWLDAFDLRKEDQAILRILAEWQQVEEYVRVTDLYELARDEQRPDAVIEQTLRWAEILHLIESRSDEQHVTEYRLDPVVARLLLATT